MELSEAKELYDMCTEIVRRLGRKHELLKHFPDNQAFWSYKDSLITIDWRPDYFVLSKWLRRMYYPSAGEHGLEVRNHVFYYGSETPPGLWIKPYQFGLGWHGQKESLIPVDYIRALCLTSHYLKPIAPID